ncbi:hypothetical protein FNF27_04567 [Cafeteria roenbergensis]|uniref:Small-subunit processome Utp12 domain-containing protein n=1 Tax=Cafeteria roenbergensis TaxID=33653 RepID=A0A5A8E8D8_CAFRO|nr:hypothetical protein FNF27_04567 [Cafeteria roenbergensis]
MSTKTYLRYKQEHVLGLIASPSCNIAADSAGRFAASGTLERVQVWNVRRGLLHASLAEERCEAAVTYVCMGNDDDTVAAGYADGSIRLWSVSRKALITRLQGHKRGVSALVFDAEGDTLVSGSQDTTIVVWDLTAQAGVCRLRGHKDEVTALVLVDPAYLRDAAAGASSAGSAGFAGRPLLVSASKDTLLKVWDLAEQTCVQTMVGHRSEVWALAGAPAIGAAPAGEGLLGAGAGGAQAASSVAAGASAAPGRPGKRPRPVAGEEDEASGSASSAEALDVATSGLRLLSGSADAMLRTFAVRRRSAAEAAAAAIAEREAAAAAGDAGVAAMAARAVQPPFVDAMGSVARLDSGRCQGIVTSKDGRWAAVYGRGKTLELYQARPWAEVKRRVQRRRRRARERARRAEREREAAMADGDVADERNAKRGKRAAASIGTSEFDKRRADAAGSGSDDDDEDDEEAGEGTDLAGEESARPIAGDEWGLFAVVRCPNKVRSAVLLPPDAVPGARSATATADGALPPAVLVCTGDNQLELHCVDDAEARRTALPDGTSVAGSRRLGAISASGHRKDVRAVAMGPDGALVLTAGEGQLKLWNGVTGASLRTMECGFALCVEFLPGGQHAVVGTKEGAVQVFDLASGDMIEDHQDAHEGAVYALDVRADGRGVATGSADKAVKLWEIDTATAGSAAVAAGAARPSLVHARTLRMPDEVLAVRYSHHGEADASRRLLAVSLLDSTVKVFFEDTLKFFISLYGHRLPVTSMDISADSTLIATASADKNVKLWGLDFGDCHRSLFAHDDAVTSVRFIGKTHLFFTAGKDGRVRHWDGDRFVQIHECTGHTGAVWGVAVAPKGLMMASAGADRSVRVWQRSDEQVFLEEEREARAGAAMDAEIAGRANDSDPFGEAVPEAPGQDGAPSLGAAPESTAVGGGSAASVSAADRLLGAISLAVEAREAWTEYERDLESAVRDTAAGTLEERAAMRSTGEAVRPLVPPPAPKLELLKRTPAEMVLDALRAVPPADREQAILLLPFNAALELVRCLHRHVRRGVDVELCSRYILFTVRLHYTQLVASPSSRAELGAIRASIRARVGELRDIFGYTRAGLRFLDRAAASASGDGQAGFLAGDADKGDDEQAAPAKGVRFGRFRDVKLF